jgi:hypothetical protein
MFVYHAVTVKKDPLMVKTCCDFKALESACAEYAKRSAARTDAGETESEADR